MIRYTLLIVGLLLFFIQHYIQAFSGQIQVAAFLTGIIVIGVPHGAADLLIAIQNAASDEKPFSYVNFLFNYMGRLLLFAFILFLFPVTGTLLFLILAAYHFGETDLHKFRTDTFAGKILVFSYGLLILAVILLTHLKEVIPLPSLSNAVVQHAVIIKWLELYYFKILIICGLFFFFSTVFYFFTEGVHQRAKPKYLIQLICILFILYQLPMLLGFTFYFVIWHSMLSLWNIIKYIRRDGLFSTTVIVRQIIKNSLLAMAVISLVGLLSLLYQKQDNAMIYVFLGLAVLTAPHMQIMNDMYHRLRLNSGAPKVAENKLINNAPD